MHRQVLVLTLFGLFAAGDARAETPTLLSSMASDQELGVSLGAEMGAEMTPGGVHVGGAHLYRLSDNDWLESLVGVTYGNGGAGCERNRLGRTDCSFGVTSGFGFEIGARIRRTFSERYEFEPFLSAGLHVRAVSFGNDNVKGIAIPVSGVAGVRYPIQESVYAVAQSTLRLGFGGYNRGLGWKPHLSLGASLGFEFSL